jgi:hypothetical protein
MNKYQDVLPIKKNDAEIFFASNEIEKIATTLVSISFYEKDWKWVQDKCLEYLFHPDDVISGLAATCLGHVARVNRKLEKKKVIILLRSRLDNLQIAGRIEDAIDDINTYIKT